MPAAPARALVRLLLLSSAAPLACGLRRQHLQAHSRDARFRDRLQGGGGHGGGGESPVTNCAPPPPPVPPSGFPLEPAEEGDWVPHIIVDDHHLVSHPNSGDCSKNVSLDTCLRECESDGNCIGLQYEAEGFLPCVQRFLRKASGSDDDTCAGHYLAMMRTRGFADSPLVPLRKSDGRVYLRRDCRPERAKSGAEGGNSYWGVPFNWSQPGLSLLREEGYGESPLLELVTPRVLEDLIHDGIPAWRRDADANEDFVDIGCRKGQWRDLVERLRSPEGTVEGRALIVDIGDCICSMLGHGWDPAIDLQTDVVLLLHRDVNFSPATPFEPTHEYSRVQTKIPCVERDADTDRKFVDDIQAFTALAESERVLRMYFVQTPPIAHEKIIVMPLGIGSASYVRPFKSMLQRRLELDPAGAERSRRALYEASHNLAVDYRRTVFGVVQANFAKEGEPLRLRHLPWATGSRVEDVVEQGMQAVFGQSPIGIGENCFRHAELLLAGAIPVVQASLGVAAMRYLPHLAVSSWQEVTPEMLRNSYQAIWERARQGKFSFDPLTRWFWRDHIKDAARGKPLNRFYAKFPNPPVTCPSWNCTGSA